MVTSKFDIADYLDSKEMIAEYLNTVLEEGDNAAVINAIGHIAKAISMTKISEETGSFCCSGSLSLHSVIQYHAAV